MWTDGTEGPGCGAWRWEGQGVSESPARPGFQIPGQSSEWSAPRRSLDRVWGRSGDLPRVSAFCPGHWGLLWAGQGGQQHPAPPHQMSLSSPGIVHVPRFRTSALLSRTEGTGYRRAEWKGETGKEGMRVPRMQWGQATCLENLWQTRWWLNGPRRAQEGLCWPDLCMYRDNRMSWTHRTPAPPHGGARTTGRAFCESCQTGLRGQRTARLGSDLRR